MTQEQQNQAWQSLPQEIREAVSERYRGLKATADSNATSNTAKRRTRLRMEEIENIFGNGNLEAVTDCCQSEPKFKIGDKVRIICDGVLKGLVTEITYVDEGDDIATYQIDNEIAFKHGFWFSDFDLEPCTEPDEHSCLSSEDARRILGNPLRPTDEEIWRAIKRLPVDPYKPFRLRVEVSIRDNNGVMLEDSQNLIISPPGHLELIKRLKSEVEDIAYGQTMIEERRKWYDA